jgi:hypothetical protein
VVDVVDEPHVDAAPGRSDERADDDRCRLRPEPEVVEGELERPLRRVQEGADLPRDVDRALAAVGQRPDVDQACR